MARPKKDDANGGSIGHNSNLNDNEKKKLSGFVIEIERLEEQARELSSDRGNIYKSAKEQGFDTKALKRVIALRRMTSEKRTEFESAVDAYMHALGDFVSTPLGQAAMPQQAQA